MPMELRKRKTPANPPPPAPAKRTKSAKPTEKKTVASKAKIAAASIKKTVEKTVEKKEEPVAKGDEKPEENSAEKPAEKAAEKPIEKPAEKAAESEAAPTKKGKGKTSAKDAPDAKPTETPPESKLKVGDSLPTELPDFQLDDGKTTNLNDLLETSDKGIVIFSYTKASTPGCTTQACAMRDNISVFISAGWAVYGLSCDSVTANANWKAKQKLNYPLISDPSAVIHTKLAINKGNKGSRSVVVVQKEGRIVKEIKTVTPTNSLDVAKKAAGIATETITKKDVVTNKTKEAATSVPVPAESKPAEVASA